MPIVEEGLGLKLSTDYPALNKAVCPVCDYEDYIPDGGSLFLV